MLRKIKFKHFILLWLIVILWFLHCTTLGRSTKTVLHVGGIAARSNLTTNPHIALATQKIDTIEPSPCKCLIGLDEVKGLLKKTKFKVTLPADRILHVVKVKIDHMDKIIYSTTKVFRKIVKIHIDKNINLQNNETRQK